MAHEEFAALAAARVAGVPSVFISAWLPPAASMGAESLMSTSSILVIDKPGLFPVPPGVTARVHYSGPILRKMKYTWKDRLVLRRENEIEDDALAILVVPGGWATEAKAPIFEMVFSAYLGIKHEPRRLIWLAGKDANALRQRTTGMKSVSVLDYCDPIERIMAACDVVITKGTRGITLDAACVGVPSISLSPGLNPVDDMMVPRIRNNTALMAKAVTADILKQYIEEAVASCLHAQLSHALPLDGVATAARILIEEIRRLGISQGRMKIRCENVTTVPAETHHYQRQ